MLRRHRSTLLALLIAAPFAAATGAIWAWVTGRHDTPPAVIAAIALIGCVAFVVLELTLERRRTRVVPAHSHRKGGPR